MKNFVRENENMFSAVHFAYGKMNRLKERFIMYTCDDVKHFVEDEDVRFIRLTFFDIYGTQKNISILPDQLDRAFAAGIAIDAFAVAGFDNSVHGDLYLRPDPGTFTILPWRSVDGSVVFMICDIYYPDGAPFEKDCRQLLKKATKLAGDAGISLRLSTEFEFYLFRLDENGRPSSIPLDRGGYMDVAPADHGEDVRRAICFTLEEMGLQPQASYHQCGPGQNEVDFHASAPVRAADEASLFKWVVKAVASTNGLWADFSPRPLKDEPGNGLHVNMQVESVDPFGFGIESDEVDEKFRHFLAGVLDHIREITLFANPVRESYLRLGRKKAPLAISWSHRDRSQLVRVTSDHRNRLELRSPDCASNPYLLFTLLILAGLDGIERGLEPSEPVGMIGPDVYHENAECLPCSLDEAISAAISSEFIRNNVPESILAHFVERLG